MAPSCHTSVSAYDIPRKKSAPSFAFVPCCSYERLQTWRRRPCAGRDSWMRFDPEKARLCASWSWTSQAMHCLLKQHSSFVLREENSRCHLACRRSLGHRRVVPVWTMTCEEVYLVEFHLAMKLDYEDVICTKAVEKIDVREMGCTTNQSQVWDSKWFRRCSKTTTPCCHEPLNR